MKKFLIWTLIIMLSVMAIYLYCTYKTHYLNLKFYNVYTKSYQLPDYMEVRELKLKAEPYEKGAVVLRVEDREGIDRIVFEKSLYSDVYTDKEVIKKVMDYLNSIPLVYTTEEIFYSINSEKKYIRFYNERGINVGWINLHEEYLFYNGNLQAYKVRNEGTLIISGLENLDFD